jgi:hypothetical protein
MQRMPSPVHPTHSAHICSRKAGFSLVFISILLTAAALLFVSFLPGKKAGDVNYKLITNERKLEKVEEATRGFMAANGRRPCPADGQYGLGSPNFGVESISGGVCNITAGMMGPDAGTGNIVGGVIPVTALNLSPDYAFDEFGRFFTYAIDKRATITGTPSTPNTCLNLMNYPANNGKGGIQIKSTGTAVSALDQVMVAYISHGTSGFGAFLPNGSTVQNRMNNGSTDPDMQVNAGVNSYFAYTTNSWTNVKVQKSKTATFDDVVWYRNDQKNTCCLGAKCTSFDYLTYPGCTANAQLGILSSIAVGDVNGDGYPDLIVYGNGGSGTVYVLFGGPSGFPSSLCSLNGTNGFEIDGDATTQLTIPILAPHFFGTTNNGHNVADIVINGTNGTPGYREAVIIYGGPNKKDGNPWSTCPCTVTNLLNNGDGILITPTTPLHIRDAYFVGAAGDINKDGYDDLVFSNVGQGSYNGAAYVVFGGPTKKDTTAWAATQMLGNLTDGANGFELDGANANDFCGNTIGTADFNGDGYADVIVGCPSHTTGGNANDGSVFVVWGKSGGWSSTNKLTDSGGNAFINGLPPTGNGIEFYGGSANQHLGQAFGSGNIYGHAGIGDLLLLDDNNNAFTIFGGPTMANGNSWQVTNSLAAGGAVINGANGFELTGISSAAVGVGSFAAGDVNGDGKADLVLGFPFAGNNGSNSGSTYVVFGGPVMKNGTAWSATNDMSAGGAVVNGINGLRLDGAAANYELGYSTAVGNFSNSAYSSIVIGAPGGGAGNGHLYIVFGKASGWPTTYILQ